MKQGSPSGRVYLGARGWQSVEELAPRSAVGTSAMLAMLIVVGAAALAFMLPSHEAPVPSSGPPRAEQPAWGASPFTAGPPAAAEPGASPREAPAVATVAPPTTATATLPTTLWEVDFQAAKARFHDLRWFTDDPVLAIEEAKRADAALPGLVARGLVQPGDALLVKADVLEVLEADESRRVEAFLHWWSEHPLARPPASSSDPRAAEKLHRERSLLIEWHSQPSVDRELPDLEEQLHRLWAGGR
ncbi:MAG TPA: hypothetical protein VHM00_15305 [Caldimonas sp.]|jgi:hypothetical protein|nr:hypothetical protein [Caldimonas sp.]HEX2542437.1 hypothetical protein [Caldimonas sp.]